MATVLSADAGWCFFVAFSGFFLCIVLCVVSCRYDIDMDVDGAVDDAALAELLLALRGMACVAHVRTLGSQSNAWFPRSPADLDLFAHKTLDCGAELEADHPGFNDPVYRARRALIVENALSYRYGQELPRVEYTADEIATWRTVYLKLTALFPTHACRQYNHVLPLLEKNCGYGPDSIPQLEDVSRFLRAASGFSLRPVQGLLSARDFLNGLAFRTFHSTQYIRHHSRPLYTPEPDVCHELLGHAPLLADPHFAEFSQEIGMASLGASDEDIEKLATLYWFTVEFGLCLEDGQPKAYGAGLLSSFGELEYCLSAEPVRKPLNMEETCMTKYPITSYQPVYFVAKDFASMTADMRHWASKMNRPFALHYNAYTSRVEVLDSKERLVALASSIRADFSALTRAIENM